VTGHTTVLVTGMSGVGKSTALTELARRGYVTVDTDEGPWIRVFEGEPLWRGFSRLSPDTIAQVAVDEQRGRVADPTRPRAAPEVEPHGPSKPTTWTGLFA